MNNKIIAIIGIVAWGLILLGNMGVFGGAHNQPAFLNLIIALSTIGFIALASISLWNKRMWLAITFSSSFILAICSTFLVLFGLEEMFLLTMSVLLLVHFIAGILVFVSLFKLK